MENPQDFIILFDDKSDQALAAIMTKYQLEEPLDKMVDNTLNDKPNNVVVLSELTTSFMLGEISEKALTDSIQTKVGVSPQTAGSVAKEIISTLVPTLKKLSETDIERQNQQSAVEANQITNVSNEAIMPKIKAPIEVEKIMQERQKSALKEKIKGPAQVSPKEPPATKIKKAPPAAAQPAQPKNKKSDSYRESID